MFHVNIAVPLFILATRARAMLKVQNRKRTTHQKTKDEKNVSVCLCVMCHSIQCDTNTLADIGTDTDTLNRTVTRIQYNSTQPIRCRNTAVRWSECRCEWCKEKRIKSKRRSRRIHLNFKIFSRRPFGSVPHTHKLRHQNGIIIRSLSIAFFPSLSLSRPIAICAQWTHKTEINWYVFDVIISIQLIFPREGLVLRSVPFIQIESHSNALNSCLFCVLALDAHVCVCVYVQVYDAVIVWTLSIAMKAKSDQSPNILKIDFLFYQFNNSTASFFSRIERNDKYDARLVYRW